MASDHVSAVLRTSTATGNARLLLVIYAHLADVDGYAYPSTETLAAWMRTTQRTIKRLRSQLVKSGDLERVRGGNHSGDKLVVRVTIKGVAADTLNDDKGVAADTLNDDKGVAADTLNGENPVIRVSHLTPYTVYSTVQYSDLPVTTEILADPVVVDSDGERLTKNQINNRSDDDPGLMLAYVIEWLRDNKPIKLLAWRIDNQKRLPAELTEDVLIEYRDYIERHYGAGAVQETSSRRRANEYTPAEYAGIINR